MSAEGSPPSPFESWEEARSYFALESIFLGQLLDRRPTQGNEKRYHEAARLAVEANALCDEPYPDEDMPESGASGER